jgi:C1A family cysteine protease
VACFEPGHQEETLLFNKFNDFLTTHNKSYATIEEFTARFQVFKSNYKKLQTFAVGDETTNYKVGVTRFADLTTQEFKRKFLNLDMGVKVHMPKDLLSLGDEAEDSLDYRTKGVLNAVKDQGQCGSCWAFSAIGNIEPLYAIKSGKLLNLYEQQLVDCDRDEDQGCNGGLMDNAFAYLVSAGGAEQSKDYPYKARDQTCKFDKTKSVVQLSGFKDIAQDEAEIEKALTQVGPLSVAINAEPLQWYDSGIYDGDDYECDPDGLNHGVVIVGYGVEKGVKYWIVRNSWSASWGEKGYFRFARKSDAKGKGTCGINTNVSTAVLA